jgi:GcrA cell cycle regulator
MTKQTWTDERITMLKQMWGAGKTAAEIATHIGGAITRNAVIGKAHRLGLSGRISPITTKKIEKTHHVPPTAAAMIVEPVYEKSASSVSMLQLTEKTCRWPLGDPKKAGFHFCGARPVPGVPYCGHHATLAYQGTTRKFNMTDDVDNHSKVAEDALDVLDDAVNA